MTAAASLVSDEGQVDLGGQSAALLQRVSAAVNDAEAASGRFTNDRRKRSRKDSDRRQSIAPWRGPDSDWSWRPGIGSQQLRQVWKKKDKMSEFNISYMIMRAS